MNDKNHETEGEFTRLSRRIANLERQLAEVRSAPKDRWHSLWKLATMSDAPPSIEPDQMQDDLVTIWDADSGEGQLYAWHNETGAWVQVE